MRKILLSIIVAFLPALALADGPIGPVTAQAIRTNANCAALACVRSGQVCMTGTVLYTCDTVTGFYAGVASVDSGSRLNLEGPHGDSYIVRDATVPSIDVYYDGVVRAQIRPTSMGPGVCPSPLNTMEMGWCFLAGRLVFRDTSGIYYPVGVQVAQ
jgi:hypothetical protein